MHKIFGKTKHIHFVGIGGIGMSGMAELLHNHGFEISGSDINTSDRTEHLKSIGITVYKGHSNNHIKKTDLIVYSSAVNLENPEIDKETKDFLVKDLRDNFNKREKANAKYYYLKYERLRYEMFKLSIVGTPDSFLEDIERLKKQSGFNNLWLEAEHNNWFKKRNEK